MLESVYFYEFWSNSNVIFCCKPSDYEALKHEKVFLIANHSHDIDILLWMVVMNHFGKLGNDICYAKDFVKYIPFIGWHIYLSQHVRISTCYTKDKETIENRISQIPKNSNDVWVVLMPEGPKFTRERHAEAIKFALDNKYSPLIHHLIPRTKGFVTTYQALNKEEYKTILNGQVAFETKNFAVPKYSNMMNCRRMQAYVYLERIPMENVSATFHGIYEIFKQKDILHESFIENGKFSTDIKFEKFEMIPMYHHKYVKFNFECWCFIWVVVWILSSYKILVWICLPDVQHYSNAKILIKIACEIHDFIFNLCRCFLY